MDITSAGFDARHSEHINNTEVLLALLTQNKELEGTVLSAHITGGFLKRSRFSFDFFTANVSFFLF